MGTWVSYLVTIYEPLHLAEISCPGNFADAQRNEAKVLLELLFLNFCFFNWAYLRIWKSRFSLDQGLLFCKWAHLCIMNRPLLILAPLIQGFLTSSLTNRTKRSSFLRYFLLITRWRRFGSLAVFPTSLITGTVCRKRGSRVSGAARLMALNTCCETSDRLARAQPSSRLLRVSLGIAVRSCVRWGFGGPTE